MVRLLLGIVVGFIVGSAAGRGRYEQIKKTVTDVANTPQVQKAVKKADDFVADKAPGLHDVAEAAAESGTPKPDASTSDASKSDASI